MSYEDAHREICSALSRLCPRLVPEPLWGVSLAGLVRLDPRLVDDVLCESSGCCWEALECLSRWWFGGLPRRGVCGACGCEGAVEVDEDWRYYVEGGRGVAVLAGLRFLCGRCHLAKHQGFARVHDRGREALEHLARVNGLEVEEAEELVDKAFSIWRKLSRIGEWRIVLGELPGLGDDIKRVVERVLNAMVHEGYFVKDKWLWYRSLMNGERLEEEASRETKELLCRALGVMGERFSVIGALVKLKADDKAREKLVREIERELSKAGIKVLPRETMLALTKLRVTDLIIRASIGEPLLCNPTTTGKWMIFVKRELQGMFFAEVIRRLKRKGLDYTAKTAGMRGDTRKEHPVIIYVPSFLALRIVREVALTMLEVRDEMGISKPVMFKPDTFTLAGIYSNTVRGMRSYIYMLR